jgi:dolichyl-phosphate-mannose--protein O-mannosyl transferase
VTTTANQAAPPVGRQPVPDIIRRRLAAGHPREVWSWVVTGVITAIAGIVRLVELDRPGHIIFDETYYAPNAYALTRFGVEWNVAEGGAHPVDGAPVLADGAAYVVHPPLGKWLIAVGEWMFGYSPFGWRFAAAVAGTLSVLMIVRIGRRLFGSTALGAAAGLLVALDGMHVVMSRTALLDIFLLFFVVAAFGALLLDRDSRRRRWLRAREAGRRPRFDWRTGVPWWGLAAAALLGAACAVKWSAAFFIPVFLLLMVIWEVGARRSAGVREPWLDTLLIAPAWAFLGLFVVVLVYLASWTGWFATDHGYFRNRLADIGETQLPVIGTFQNLYHYHRAAFGFHSGLAEGHQYESAPWQWLLLGRPVAFHWSTTGECGAESCASEVLLVGTPLLWWSFLPALVVAAWIGIARRDWRVPAILLGAAAGLLPWFYYDLISDRVMFYFYALPAQPFLVLAVVYVLGAMMAPRVPGREVLGVDRRTLGVVVAGAYVMLVALNFAYFYPIYTGQVIPYEAWQARMWLGSRWV